ncbi:MAG: AAA family ATPase [Gemmatimonadota bacterium]
MAQPYFLKCLGIPELRSPDGEPVKFRVRKHLALLVYLAVESRAQHDRDRLVELLWPRSPWRRARHSLATALSILRKTLGDTSFTTTRSHVRFAPADLELDLGRLESGEIIGDGVRPPLDIDGFLRGFEIDAPDFAHWRDREHARRLPAIHVGLLALIDHSRRLGATSDISAYGERILAIDSLAEEGIRARMEALALAGDRFSAIRVYEEWKDRLEEELGAVPSELLDGMVMRLRKHGPSTSEPSAVPAEQWRDRRFVGRLAEHRRIYEAWEATHQFKPVHMLLMGDSGVGKTTLAQRLVTAASLEGASVSRVQCFQMEQKLPFNAVAGLVVGLLGRPGIAATSPEGLAEIGRIVPQIRARFPNLPAPKESEGESARILFAEGVMDLLGAVMNEHPLLLVVDDYHMADEASLSVLHLIMRRLPEPRMMIVLTARPVEEGETTQARRIREGAGYLGLVQLDLAPMVEDETRELLAVILADGEQKPSAPERRALVRASGGYPMVLELLVQDWRLNGPESLALAFSAMKTEFRTSPSSAESYSRLASRIIPDLPETSKLVLDLASVLGSRLNDLTWYGLADLAIAQTMGAISGLVTKRILRDIGSGLEFINEIVRAEVYRGIPSPVRVALHEMVADRLLVEVSQGVWVPGLELAWHLIRAGRTEPATPHLLRGAQEAIQDGAPDVAILALQSGIDQVERASRGSAALLLAIALQELGAWEESLLSLERLGNTLEGRETEYADVLRSSARWELRVLDEGERRKACGALLTAISNQHEAEWISRAAVVAARMACTSRDEAEMLRALSVIKQLRESLPAGSNTVGLVVAEAILSFNLRRWDDLWVLLNLARGLMARDNRRDSLLVQVLLGAGSSAGSSGRYDEERHLLTEALIAATRLDNATLIGRIHSNAAVALVRLGLFQEAAQTAKSARQLLTTGADQGFLLTATFVEAWALALLGKAQEARAVLHLGDQENGWGEPWIEQSWLLMKADVLLTMGYRHQAMTTALGGLTGDRSRPLAVGLVGRFCRWLSRAMAEGIISGESSRKLIREFYSRRHTLDAVDRIEVADALLTTDLLLPIGEGEIVRSEIRLGVQSLPPATADQLATFGVAR